MYILAEWVRSRKNEDRQFDVRERAAIQNGTLRAAPAAQLVGETTNVKWKAGQFFPAVIIATGTLEEMLERKDIEDEDNRQKLQHKKDKAAKNDGFGNIFDFMNLT